MGDTAFDQASLNGEDENFTIVVLIMFTILGTLVMTKRVARGGACLSHEVCPPDGCESGHYTVLHPCTLIMCPVLTCFPFSLRSLLIAMMNNTYNLISADALKYWCAVTLFPGPE